MAVDVPKLRQAVFVNREKKRLEAEALARFEREEEEARIAAEAAAAAKRSDHVNSGGLGVLQVRFVAIAAAYMGGHRSGCCSCQPDDPSR